MNFVDHHHCLLCFLTSFQWSTLGGTVCNLHSSARINSFIHACIDIVGDDENKYSSRYYYTNNFMHVLYRCKRGPTSMEYRSTPHFAQFPAEV